MRRVIGILLVVVMFGGAFSSVYLYRSWKAGILPWEERHMNNVYIVKDVGNIIQVYNGEKREEYKVRGDSTRQEYQGIADIQIQGTYVKKIVCKPEKIKGKILEIGEKSIDIENYGMVTQASSCTYYHLKPEVSKGSHDELYIGQESVEFIVANGEICSVIFLQDDSQSKENSNVATQEAKEMIRVVIKTNDFAAYEHANVVLRGTKKMVVKNGKETKEYQPGEQVIFTTESMKEKRSIITSEEGGRIEVLSVKRNMGNPSYRGRLEIVKATGGLHLINELALEEYLYGVLPSEMPASYEIEALKAQAVCARSYAMQHIKNNRMKEIGAHVDDSVSYQVYNNTNEDPRCNQAVDETIGQKAYYNGGIAATYFFSTSCGVTTSAKDVSFTTTDVPYLQGKLQEKSLLQGGDFQKAQLVSGMLGEDALFEKFLEEDREVLEKSQSWYRWSTSISLGDMEHNINTKIGSRSQAAGDKIRVKQADGSYVPQQINGIGTLKKVKIKERGSGGVATMAVLHGSEATVRVYSEYNIRSLLFHDNAIIRKNNGTDVSGLTMLPSGFFVLKRSGKSYEIRGGGFGHGTGMSQTGANELAQSGKKHQEILQFYFPGVEVKV